MTDFPTHVDPLPYLVRHLKGATDPDEDFAFVGEDRLMVLTQNVYVLRAITSMWRDVLSQNHGEITDVYGDEMLAYTACQSISYLCSDEAIDDPSFEPILKIHNREEFDLKIFEALRNYLDLLHETGNIGNDIWKRAMDAIYSVCIKSKPCRKITQSVADKYMNLNTHHWSVELIRDLEG